MDVYEDDLEGVVTAEVEFGSAAQSGSFQPPAWLGEELTGDDRYANRNLALAGKPDRPASAKAESSGVSRAQGGDSITVPARAVVREGAGCLVRVYGGTSG